jgi:hypothetical protein
VNLGNVCQQILLLFLCLQSVQMNFYYWHSPIIKSKVVYLYN